MSARIESVQSASKAGPAEKPAPYESPEYAEANLEASVRSRAPMGRLASATSLKPD